jgi:hypothetical protein
MTVEVRLAITGTPRIGNTSLCWFLREWLSLDGLAMQPRRQVPQPLPPRLADL